MSDLRRTLANAINGAHAEGNSHTPDYILANYLVDALAAFDNATKARDAWHGFQPRFATTETVEAPK